MTEQTTKPTSLLSAIGSGMMGSLKGALTLGFATALLGTGLGAAAGVLGLVPATIAMSAPAAGALMGVINGAVFGGLTGAAFGGIAGVMEKRSTKVKDGAANKEDAENLVALSSPILASERLAADVIPGHPTPLNDYVNHVAKKSKSPCCHAEKIRHQQTELAAATQQI